MKLFLSGMVQSGDKVALYTQAESPVIKHESPISRTEADVTTHNMDNIATQSYGTSQALVGNINGDDSSKTVYSTSLYSLPGNHHLSPTQAYSTNMNMVLNSLNIANNLLHSATSTQSWKNTAPPGGVGNFTQRSVEIPTTFHNVVSAAPQVTDVINPAITSLNQHYSEFWDQKQTLDYSVPHGKESASPTAYATTVAYQGMPIYNLSREAADLYKEETKERVVDGATITAGVHVSTSAAKGVLIFRDLSFH